MNTKFLKRLGLTLVASLIVAQAGVAANSEFRSELLALQREWAQANFVAESKKDRRSAFADVVEHANQLSARYPSQAEVIAWEGIVLSTYAGEVSAFSAMKYAKAARDKLLLAENLQPDALNGGIYASLGALYSKVPGGFVGFGDNELAREYFLRALEVDSNNIDNNYFYGEFLIKQGDYSAALEVLNRALSTSVVADRPVFDAGRRAEIEALILQAKQS